MGRHLNRRRRFEVLTRDSFTCQYCGRKAPDTQLEVDHIIPVARGGSNDLESLSTSCIDCNQGKGDALLASREDLFDLALNRCDDWIDSDYNTLKAICEFLIEQILDDGLFSIRDLKELISDRVSHSVELYEALCIANGNFDLGTLFRAVEEQLPGDDNYNVLFHLLIEYLVRTHASDLNSRQVIESINKNEGLAVDEMGDRCLVIWALSESITLEEFDTKIGKWIELNDYISGRTAIETDDGKRIYMTAGLAGEELEFEIVPEFESLDLERTDVWLLRVRRSQLGLDKYFGNKALEEAVNDWLEIEPEVVHKHLLDRKLIETSDSVGYWDLHYRQLTREGRL